MHAIRVTTECIDTPTTFVSCRELTGERPAVDGAFQLMGYNLPPLYPPPPLPNPMDDGGDWLILSFGRDVHLTPRLYHPPIGFGAYDSRTSSIGCRELIGRKSPLEEHSFKREITGSGGIGILVMFLDQTQRNLSESEGDWLKWVSPF